MRIGIALALAAVTGISGLVAVPGTAYAVNSNISGTACRNYNAAEATDIDYLTNSVRNLNAAPRYVICPIVRSPTASNVVSIRVAGFTAPGTLISCTLTSYAIDGSTLGFQSFTVQNPFINVPFDQPLAAPGAFGGNATLLCLLPGNGGGVIYGIDVVQ